MIACSQRLALRTGLHRELQLQVVARSACHSLARLDPCDYVALNCGPARPAACPLCPQILVMGLGPVRAFLERVLDPPALKAITAAMQVRQRACMHGPS